LEPIGRGDKGGDAISAKRGKHSSGMQACTQRLGCGNSFYLKGRKGVEKVGAQWGEGAKVLAHEKGEDNARTEKDAYLQQTNKKHQKSKNRWPIQEAGGGGGGNGGGKKPKRARDTGEIRTIGGIKKKLPPAEFLTRQVLMVKKGGAQCKGTQGKRIGGTGPQPARCPADTRRPRAANDSKKRFAHLEWKGPQAKTAIREPERKGKRLGRTRK